MVTLTVQRARELLGDKANSLPDEKIQAEIDIMMALANRCYDLIISKNTGEKDDDNTNPTA